MISSGFLCFGHQDANYHWAHQPHTFYMLCNLSLKSLSSPFHVYIYMIPGCRLAPPLPTMVWSRWQPPQNQGFPWNSLLRSYLITYRPIWSPYGPYGTHTFPYGPIWSPYGTIWNPCGLIWVHMDPYGAHMAPCRPKWGPIWTPYGAICAPYGLIWTPYESIWVPYGPLWNPYWPIWNPYGPYDSLWLHLVCFDFLWFPLIWLPGC